MKSLQEFLSEAGKNHWSTGHFNASELDQVRTIVEACKELGAPSIIGTSEGERKHLGLGEAVVLRDALRKEYGIPVFLNADHTKSVAAAKAAIDAGYDSVHIDLSALPFEENVRGTQEVVEYTRINVLKSDFRNSEVGLPNIEGELGYLRGESKVQHEKIEVKKEDYTNPAQAKEFVEKTGVDRLAIAVGNIHGISLEEPALDIERIRAIRAAIPQEVALVLHAGSGIHDEQIRAAIEAGIANIHINTDIRIAFTRALRETMAQDLDESAMYKLDASAIEAMKRVVKEKLRLFGSVNRISN